MIEHGVAMLVRRGSDNIVHKTECVLTIPTDDDSGSNPGITNYSGALVQSVRMPACHAGGHGFESRTHRKLKMCFNPCC